MKNKTIILGTISFNWNFAKGNYSCKCAKIETTNAFDRVICGILYHSKNCMSRLELASLMGFNVIDDPIHNLFHDESERVIFMKAIASLVSYGLIIDEGATIKLTDLGRTSFETQTKQFIENKEIDLWFDEFIGAEFNKEMLEGLEVKRVYPQDNYEWNTLLKAPLDILMIQHKDLVNLDMGKSVLSITNIDMEYFQAKLECNVCYNIQTKQLFIVSKSESSSIDVLLSENILLKNHLLESFFNDQNISAIFKPTYQEDAENLVLSQDNSNNQYSNIITSIDNFFSIINSELLEKKTNYIYFSVNTITEKLKSQIKRLDSSVICCIDYVNGDFEESSNLIFEDNNVCYYRLDNLRTKDLCVFNGKNYVSLPYVIEYNGSEYSVPLIFEQNDVKYNYKSLYKPYLKFILDRVIISLQKELSLIKIKKSSSSFAINNILSCCNSFENIGISLNSSEFAEQYKLIDDLLNRVKVTWENILHDKLEKLESEIITGQDKITSQLSLKQIESDINETTNDKELLDFVSDIKKRLKGDLIDGPKTILRSLYILDTSVFMEMPDILDRFSLIEDKVIVPRAMEQELDGLSHDNDSLKKQKAHKAELLLIRKAKDYPQFVSIKNDINKDLLPVGFDRNKNDNDMLAAAIELEKDDKFGRIVIVSNDYIFNSNVNDCITSNIISDRIEAINLNELLIRLGE